MSSSAPQTPDALLRAAAARWLVARDRGLSAAEAIEFELWLAADPRHAAAMQRLEGAWQRLDRLPDSLAQHVLAEAAQRRRRLRWWRGSLAAGTLAAAAALTVLFTSGRFSPPPPVTAPLHTTTELQASGPRILTLADGTEVWLNAGCTIVERFTPTLRQVLLQRGEAFFTVAKDPARPFLVTAGALHVRAVGTAFHLQHQATSTEVMVLEGRVAVVARNESLPPEPALPTAAASPLGAAAPGTPAALIATATFAPPPAGGTPLPTAVLGATSELQAGERAILFAPTDPGEVAASPAPTLVVQRVNAAEIDRTLAWQDGLLRLGGQTLAEIAAEFGRRTGQRVVFVEPGLAQIRLGGRFRADDAEGFATLLATLFNIELEHAEGGTLMLRKKKSSSP